MITRIDEGIWLRRPESGKRRTLAIVGGMHGDEIEGITVLDELMDPDHPVWQTCRDEVWLVRGNPEAIRLGTRGSVGGADLNRFFGVEVPEGDDPESERARTLRKWIKPVTALLDLHQTTRPTPPLAVVRDTPHHIAEVKRLGLSLVVVGAEKVFGEAMLSSMIDRSGGIGITVETGQIGSPRALETARTATVRFLSGATAEGSVGVIEIIDALRSPGPNLKFTRPLANGTEIRAGEVIASWDGGDVRLPVGGIALLPREEAATGDPCLLIAQERGTA